MTANFRLVANATETDPREFAAQRIGDRLTETGFADSGRPEETHNWAVTFWVEFAHGEILDQPLLYLFQIVMIAIEDLLRLIVSEVAFAQFRPGQIGDRLDIANNHRIFRAGRGNKTEPF